MLDPDMTAPEMRLHMGELTDNELLVARAAIGWANSITNAENLLQIPSRRPRLKGSKVIGSKSLKDEKDFIDWYSRNPQGKSE